MSQFDESKIRRDGEGKFANKGPSAEAGGVDLASTEHDQTEAKMIALGDTVAKHHPNAENVVINSGEISYEDIYGNRRMFSAECAAEVDKITEGLDRTDPAVWEKFAEDYDQAESEYQYPESMTIDDSGRLIEARMPVTYLQDGYPQESDPIDDMNLKYEQQVLEEGR